MTRSAVRRLIVVALAVRLGAWGLASGQESDSPKGAPPADRPAAKKRVVPLEPQESPLPGLPPVSPPANPAPLRARPALPGAAAKASSRVAASKEEIAGWVHELDADEFLTRETAMLQLLEAGPAVLAALKPVLTGGSLEATSRALFIVRQIGLTADIDTQDQSGQLLAELAGRNEAPALARRAAAALAELTEQRGVQAITDLENLGAKVTRTQALGGILLDEPALSIEVDEAFQGNEHDLRRLKWVTGVPVLILCGKQVTDGWIKQAAAMPELQELHLYQARIGDEGLAPLAGETMLKQVGLYYTPVGDAVLAPLAKLPLLGFVKLYGTKVTIEGVNRFKAESGVSVDYRRGAFLGVAGIDVVDSACQVSSIHDGSPAAKAGLLPKDTIIRFGKDEVKNFSSLTELISRCDAGDEVEIEVLRRIMDDQGNETPQKIATKATLAPWELEPAVRNSRR
jgi:hypothetical protein